MSEALVAVGQWFWSNGINGFIFIWLPLLTWQSLRPRTGYKFHIWPKLPSGYTFKLVYSDEKPTNPIDGVTYCTILSSKTHDITGKPDFIYSDRRGRKFFPTELKSHTLNTSDRKDGEFKPRDKDLHQLYMYFLIVGETYGRVPYGWLIYSNGMFKVYNTRQARKKITRLLADMRHMLTTGQGQPNPSFINCKHCVCRETVCEHND